MGMCDLFECALVQVYCPSSVSWSCMSFRTQSEDTHAPAMSRRAVGEGERGV